MINSVIKKIIIWRFDFKERKGFFGSLISKWIWKFENKRVVYKLNWCLGSSFQFDESFILLHHRYHYFSHDIDINFQFGGKSSGLRRLSITVGPSHLYAWSTFLWAGPTLTNSPTRILESLLFRKMGPAGPYGYSISWLGQTIYGADSFSMGSDW